MPIFSIYFVLGKAQVPIVKELLRAEKNEYVVFSVYDKDFNNCIKISGRDLFLNIIKIYFIIFKANKFEAVNLYTPHFVNFLANFFFQKRKVNVYYLYDGILNLRTACWSELGLRKVINSNKIKSLFILHAYQYFGHKINDDKNKKVKGLFLPSYIDPNLVNFNGNIFFIKEKIPKLSLIKKRTVLVLEPTCVVDDNEKLRSYFAILRKFCIENNIEEVFIKRHPAIRKEVSYDCLRPINAVLLDKQLPAEKLFFLLAPEYLLGDHGSALINIKLMYSQTKVYSVSYKLGFKNDDPSLKEVFYCFDKLGIIFL